MSKEQVSIKLWKETRQKLRMLHALTGASMAAEVERLVTGELARLQTLSAQEDRNARSER